MSQKVRQRRPRLRLTPVDYKNLRLSVLERDNWQCQECGVMKNLEVHHITPRGRLGDDRDDNLITLCSECHGMRHRGLRLGFYRTCG